MMSERSGSSADLRVPIEPQRIDAPLTQSAIFLVLTVRDAPDAIATVQNTLAGLAGLTKTVAFRGLGADWRAR
jgi:putative iron-dependent peroxidase